MNRSDPRVQDIRRFLKNALELELSAAAVQRLKWFLYCSEHDGNTSLTCRHFDIARSTYLRWESRYDPADPSSLEDESRAPHTVRVAETDPRIVRVITKLRQAEPTLGKEPLTRRLGELYGITISSSTVGRVIRRHKLFFGEQSSHLQKRLNDAASDAEQRGQEAPLTESTQENTESDPTSPLSLLPAPGIPS